MQHAFQNANTFTRRIGGTNFQVKVHFCAEAKENIQEMILRMIENDVVFPTRPVSISAQRENAFEIAMTQTTSRAA